MGLPAIDSNGIYRVDTIPPPDGEDSAYDAPTKVGALARGQVQDLFAAAMAKETGSEPPPPVSGARPKAVIAEPIPSIEDEAEESVFEPTCQIEVANARSTPPAITPTYLPQTSIVDIYAQPPPKRRVEIVHIAAIVTALGFAGLIASFFV
ncbi:MAG TPA: hypothetical protein VIF62_15050 [Labilithrix sp.]|jgi:hypothetical protein